MGAANLQQCRRLCGSRLVQCRNDFPSGLFEVEIPPARSSYPGQPRVPRRHSVIRLLHRMRPEIRQRECLALFHRHVRLSHVERGNQIIRFSASTAGSHHRYTRLTRLRSLTGFERYLMKVQWRTLSGLIQTLRETSFRSLREAPATPLVAMWSRSFCK